MKWKTLTATLLMAMAMLAPEGAGAAKLLKLKVIDKDYLMLHFRDG